jgi:hypothetical protein
MPRSKVRRPTKEKPPGGSETSDRGEEALPGWGQVRAPDKRTRSQLDCSLQNKRPPSAPTAVVAPPGTDHVAVMGKTTHGIRQFAAQYDSPPREGSNEQLQKGERSRI